MLKALDPVKIKSIVLIGLILGCLVFAGAIPVEITLSDDFIEAHGFDR